MLEKTMDWKRVDVTFDSQDHSEVSLYLGSRLKSGKIWWSDVRIEPAGWSTSSGATACR